MDEIDFNRLKKNKFHNKKRGLSLNTKFQKKVKNC